MKTHHIGIRVTEYEKELILRVAILEGRSLSQFVRHHTLEYARSRNSRGFDKRGLLESELN